MASYTAQQLKWANAVVARVKAKNLPADQGQRAADIALATCLVETNLKMYANGNNPESMKLPHDAVGWDHGSVGLFQQQVGGAPNSTANWGTTAQLMDPGISTDKFIAALLKTDWLHMTNGAAAQRVQGSAFPDRYAQRDAEAVALRKQLWSGASVPSKRTLTSQDVKDIETMIANAFRAYHLGGKYGRWDPKRFGGWLKDKARGMGDRVATLEQKVK